MASHDPVAPVLRETTRGSLVPDLTAVRALVLRCALAGGESRRGIVRLAHRVRYRSPRSTGARLLVLVPAQDQEATLGRTLAALLTQTRLPDRVVVLADGCTDRTEAVARRFAGITVMRTVDNTGRRAGALNQGWRRWQAGYDQVAVVEAGTVLAPDCLQRLTEELSDADQAVGVLARSVPDRAPGADPAAAVFDARALRVVTGRSRGRGPWDVTATDPGRRLSWDLRQTGCAVLVSPAARVRPVSTPG